MHQGNEQLAYSDQPLKEGNVVSAQVGIILFYCIEQAVCKICFICSFGESLLPHDIN